MLRHFGLLLVLAAFVPAGCSIDGIEWESSGWPVEEVRHALEEEHSAENPQVECIKREVAGMEWECRAHTADAEFGCHVVAGVRKVIHEIECHQEHHEETAEHEGEAPAGEEHDPAGEEPAEEEHEPADEEPADEHDPADEEHVEEDEDAGH